MNTAYTLDMGALEVQLSTSADVADKVDQLFPVASPTKPNGMFASDCCGSNNYAK